MQWAFEQLLASGDAWKAFPVPMVLAVVFGLLVGYFLSKLRHQSVIEALKVRLEHKDDIIKFKDQAIASQVPIPTPQPPPSPLPKSSPDPRIGDINETVLRKAESKLLDAITGKKFKFVFNPMDDRSKVLTFLPDGSIGEGRNQNESHWRIHNGRIEIINAAGETYSRFFLFPDGKSLHHTNEKDLASIHGQYMTPL